MRSHLDPLHFWRRAAEDLYFQAPGSPVPRKGSLLVFPDGSFFEVGYANHGRVYDQFTETLLSAGEEAWEFVDTVQISSAMTESAVKTGSTEITPEQAKVIRDRFSDWTPRMSVWYADPADEKEFVDEKEFKYQDAFFAYVDSKATATVDGKRNKRPATLPSFNPSRLSEAFNNAKNSTVTWAGAASQMADPANPTVEELASVIAQEMVPTLYAYSPPGKVWALGYGGSVTKQVYQNVCLPYCRGVLAVDKDTLEYVRSRYAMDNGVSLPEEERGETASAIFYYELRREGLSHRAAVRYALA